LEPNELAINNPIIESQAAQMGRAPAGTVDDKDKNLVLIEYILMAVGFFIVLTAIASVIMAHIKRSDVAGTWLESHHRWLIRTFWYGLLGYVVGAVTTLIFVGWLIILATFIWTVYRVIKGFLAFNDQKPAYPDM